MPTGTGKSRATASGTLHQDTQSAPRVALPCRRTVRLGSGGAAHEVQLTNDGSGKPHRASEAQLTASGQSFKRAT